MGCMGGLTRIIVAVINTVFLLFGAAVLIIGIMFKTNWDKFKDAFEKDNGTTLGEDGNTVGIVCISFGAVMLLIALLGLIGSCCNVKWALGAYGVLTLLLLIGQIVAVAVVATNFGDAKDDLIKGLKKTQKNFNEDLSDTGSKAWAAVFNNWECCGVQDPTKGPAGGEFENFNPSSLRLKTGQTAPFPVACCSESYNYEDDAVDANLFNLPKIKECLKDGKTGPFYKAGCEQKVEDWIDDNKTTVIGVGCAIFAIELLIVIMAFWLCSRHSDDQYEQK